MPDKKSAEEGKAKYSKLKLALGAASLFLFIVGIKRTFRPDGEDAAATPAAADGTPATPPDPQAEGGAGNEATR